MKTFKEYGGYVDITVGGRSHAYGLQNPIGDLRTEPLNANKTTPLDNISKKLNPKDRLEYLKLINKALSTMPGSHKQKEIIKQLNVYRVKGKGKPLTIPK